MPAEPFQQLREGSVGPACRGCGMGREELIGVFDGFVRVQAAHGEAAHVAQPVFRSTAGQQNRALSFGGLLQEALQFGAGRLVQRRGVGGGHRGDRLEVVPDQQQPMGAQLLQDRASAGGGILQREPGAEEVKAGLQNRPVQAQGGDPRFERVPEDAVGAVDAAGFAPPPAECLGQFRLAGSTGAVQEEHPGSSRGRFQRAEQVIAADELLFLCQRRAAGLGDGGRGRQRTQSREANLAAPVVDRDGPVFQREFALRARSAGMPRHSRPPGADAFGHGAAPEQPVVEGCHEFGGGHRVDPIGHRHDGRDAARQQTSGDRRLQPLADRSGLARVEHHDRDVRRREHIGEPPGRDIVGAAVRPLEQQRALAGGGDTVPVEVHHLKGCPGVVRVPQPCR